MKRDDFTNVTKADFDKLVDAFGFDHPITRLVWCKMDETKIGYSDCTAADYSDESVEKTYKKFKSTVNYLASSGFSDEQIRMIVMSIYDEAQFCYIYELLKETQIIIEERKMHIEEITRE